MGISISGSNAISGLGGNDTDFDKVLSQLKTIEKTQLNRLNAWKSDWDLRYQAFTQIIEQIQAASSMLSQLSDKNNFVTKLVQSNNDNIITAVANASAQDVQHTISVSQVASNAIWANTGHVFASKTDVINTTGEDQYFSYTYAGKRHDFKVPANTTLESFASMLNNSSDNPGIKVSIISTGSGYVFQVAGTATGQSNDLIIHDSKLKGMDAAGSSSTWTTNSALNLGDTLTNPTSYVFDLVLQGGATKSVAVSGNATAEELVVALNNAAGGITASLAADGTLTLDGVVSFSRREASEAAYKPGGTRVSLGNYMEAGEYVRLNAPGGIADGLDADDILKFSVSLDDGTSREIEIKAGATTRDLFAALARATQSGGSADVGMDSSGWGINLSGVSGITFEAASGGAVYADRLLTRAIDPQGSKDTLGATLTSAATTISVAKDKLGQRIDGRDSGDGEKLVFTIVDKNGGVQYIDINSDATNQDLLDKLKDISGATLETDAASGKVSIKLDDATEFRLHSGSVKSQGWETSLKASTTVPATNAAPDPSASLFFTDAEGNLLLEEAPNLVYTVTTNDGKTGTLTLASGASMKDVLKAMGEPDGSGWTWTEKDADGNDVAATPPDSLGAVFTDADGNEYHDLDAVTGPVYLNVRNIQAVSGPGISGQVSQSSNWSIQRAANARYQVDNWPIKMESDTNTISDVIEGVVFTIQDQGEARISVSTDITSVEQSIQNFLDAVNSVLLTVNELMKYDEAKDVTSNDPNDIGNDNYSPSGLTSQKGNLLTGNYGVQLFKSRFSSVLGTTPPGFQSRQSATDVLSGDILASLANLGIKTDTDATSDTYGLLVIGPNSSIAAMQELDKENYTDMITNHLEAVVDFFCASGSGSSTSTDFRYGSHVEGITKAGSYEVSYTVTPDGQITNVTVGGEPAVRDESQPGYYFSVASGDPRGLSINIDDLTVGDHPPAGESPMYVRIKQGLVQTTNSFLKGELVYNDVNIPANATPSEIADAVALKSQNGALMSLRANYQAVMESIDVKIEREQRRIDTWEARQKAIFANLETLLNSYGEQQKQLEAQLAQLKGD